jgi:GTP-binding protein
MFVDEANIHVRAGDGGHGCVSFRREKFIPDGGPDGGDGGRGGSVVFVADANQNTLQEFAGKHHWRAPHGRPGQGARKAGKSGKDLIVQVPLGTIVHDEELDLTIADLDEPQKRVTIVEGGRGGKGNWHYKSSTHQAPREFEHGVKGQERHLRLELKLIADVGLAGLPNAGKSTMLSALSHARPKVADYPFTTLEPMLGIVELDLSRTLTIADIPGLIEGAADGAGLGHDFLRHIERCRAILHLVDLYPTGRDPADDYRTIRGELEAHSPELAKKREIVAVNKTDLLPGDDEAIDAFKQATGVQHVHPVSGATRTGTRPMLEALWQIVHPTNV